MTADVNPESYANKTRLQRVRWSRVTPLALVGLLLSLGMLLAAAVSLQRYLEADKQLTIRAGGKQGLTPGDEWALRFPKSALVDQRERALNQLIAFAVGALIAFVATIWLVRRRIAAQPRLIEAFVEPLPDHICKNCGYDLRGSESEQCSECGGKMTLAISLDSDSAETEAGTRRVQNKN